MQKMYTLSLFVYTLEKNAAGSCKYMHTAMCSRILNAGCMYLYSLEYVW